MPLWSSLFAVLLLSQWVAGMAACLPRLQGPAMVLCHVDTGDGAAPDSPARHEGMGCPLCAPLPPTILAGPVVLAVVAGPYFAIVAGAVAPSAVVATVDRPQQPRAPPVLS